MKALRQPRGLPSDAGLLQRAGRDPSVFSELQRRHAGELQGWFSGQIGWAAGDLPAETFARALGRPGVTVPEEAA